MINFTNKKITKVYIGRVEVSGGSSNAIVTYNIDSNNIQQLSIPSGIDVLNRVTPTKAGYTFVGWREDTVANSSVITSKTMGTSNITLYAVFKKTVKVTYYNNSTTASSTSGTQYYNNGSIVNPSFSISQVSKSGWSARGWSTATAGNAAITYSTISNRSFSDNITLYGLYSQTITLSAVSAGSTTNHTGTRYYNSAGNYTNPKFTVTNPTRSGAVFKGWSLSSSSTSISNSTISNLELSASTSRYAVFTYNNTTLKSGSTGYAASAFGGYGAPTHTILSGIDGTKYQSLTVTAQANELICAAWAIACHAFTNIKTMNGSTPNHSITLRYVCTWTIYTPEGEEADQDEQKGYPCTDGKSATVTLNLANATNQSLILAYESDVFEGYTTVSTITAIGRTVVG